MAPSNVENFSPHVIKQISRELIELTKNPCEGIKVVFNEDDVTSVQADIDGPSGTPYFGGSFRIRLVLGKNFPISPPKGFFVTKIFHPNVGRNGEICVNTLKKDWNQDLGIKHILLTVKCLLIVPNPESALNEEAGKMLLEQYDDYCKRAKMMTEIHAPKVKISSNECQHASSSQTSTSSSTTTTTSSSSASLATGSATAAIASSTSASVNLVNNIINNNSTISNNNTLNDKTASTSANIGGGSQKQAHDGSFCGDEPLTKRLNSILDCYNSTADIEQVQEQHSSQQSSQKSQSSTSSMQSKVSAMSNKNRGLKRVLRLRS